MPQFSPVSWNPPSPPSLTGEFAENDLLDAAELWPTVGSGPEDVVVEPSGSAISGLEDGRIIRISASGIDEIADVGGRPLGIEWLGDGELVVCNADLGLQRVTLNGEVTSLMSAYEGTDFIFTNNASVAADGTIYFTDTSTRWTIHEYANDMIEGRGTGRLFRLTTDGSIDLLLDGLFFANGVALDPSGESLFVAETAHYRISRYWLRGDRAGTTEIFLDNTPGFPDNLSVADGILWVAMVSPRQAMVDMILPRTWMRTLTFKMPQALKPKPVRHGIVLGYDLDGTLIHNLQSASGNVATTSGVRQHNGRLYIGSLTETHIAVLNM